MYTQDFLFWLVSNMDTFCMWHFGLFTIHTLKENLTSKARGNPQLIMHAIMYIVLLAQHQARNSTIQKRAMLKQIGLSCFSTMYCNCLPKIIVLLAQAVDLLTSLQHKCSFGYMSNLIQWGLLCILMARNTIDRRHQLDRQMM